MFENNHEPTPEELAENIASILNASTFDASDPKAFEKKLARLLTSTIRETKAHRDELLAAAGKALNYLDSDWFPHRSRNGISKSEAVKVLNAAIRRAQGGGDEV